jgi:hypothetical protein
MSDQAPHKERPKLKDILASDDLKATAGDAGMSEQDIAKVLGPLSGLPDGLFHMTLKVGEALGQSLGLRSRKTHEQSFAQPYAAVVRALVLTLLGLRYGVTTLFDTPNGAYIEAKLPKDIFSLGGTLQFDIVEQAERQIQVIGASEIKGQMFDWGKGNRALKDVLAKTEQFARRLGA